jgi:hypothetical protein
MRNLARFTLFILLAGVVAPARAAEAPRIEVAFVLDSTGSMGPWIEAARARIEAIAGDLAAGDPAPDVRFALVLYRDRGDVFVTQTHDFTRDLKKMKSWLEHTEADGGGDTPESVLEGLKAGVVGLAWTPPDGRSMKLLYLVGDAPPHHYSSSPSEAWIAREALERGIVIHTIACGDMESEGQAFFEEMARTTEGRPFRLADAAPTRRRVAPHTTSAGATSTASLGAAVSSSARAYSTALGISYHHDAPALTTRPLSVAPLEKEGLLGGEVRFVSDEAAWTDLWAAHQSLQPSGARAPLPPVDFSRWQVLALGGENAGLELVKLEAGDGFRVATVRPDERAGVRFVLIPAAPGVVIAKGGDR